MKAPTILKNQDFSLTTRPSVLHRQITFSIIERQVTCLASALHSKDAEEKAKLSIYEQQLLFLQLLLLVSLGISACSSRSNCWLIGWKQTNHKNKQNHFWIFALGGRAWILKTRNVTFLWNIAILYHPTKCLEINH